MAGCGNGDTRLARKRATKTASRQFRQVATNEMSASPPHASQTLRGIEATGIYDLPFKARVVRLTFRVLSGLQRKWCEEPECNSIKDTRRSGESGARKEPSWAKPLRGSAVSRRHGD